MLQQNPDKNFDSSTFAVNPGGTVEYNSPDHGNKHLPAVVMSCTTEPHDGQFLLSLQAPSSDLSPHPEKQLEGFQ